MLCVCVTSYTEHSDVVIQANHKGPASQLSVPLAGPSNTRGQAPRHQWQPHLDPFTWNNTLHLIHSQLFAHTGRRRVLLETVLPSACVATPKIPGLTSSHGVANVGEDQAGKLAGHEATHFPLACNQKGTDRKEQKLRDTFVDKNPVCTIHAVSSSERDGRDRSC